MKQYTFKDGFKCVASTKEEAIKKHKVVSAKKQKVSASDNNELKEIAKAFKGKIADLYINGSMIQFNSSDSIVIGNSESGNDIDNYLKFTCSKLDDNEFSCDVIVYSEGRGSSEFENASVEGVKKSSIKDVIKLFKAFFTEFDTIKNAANTYTKCVKDACSKLSSI